MATAMGGKESKRCVGSGLSPGDSRAREFRQRATVPSAARRAYRHAHTAGGLQPRVSQRLDRTERPELRGEKL